MKTLKKTNGLVALILVTLVVPSLVITAQQAPQVPKAAAEGGTGVVVPPIGWSYDGVSVPPEEMRYKVNGFTGEVTPMAPGAGAWFYNGVSVAPEDMRFMVNGLGGVTPMSPRQCTLTYTCNCGDMDNWRTKSFKCPCPQCQPNINTYLTNVCMLDQGTVTSAGTVVCTNEWGCNYVNAWAQSQCQYLIYGQCLRCLSGGHSQVVWTNTVLGPWNYGLVNYTNSYAGWTNNCHGQSPCQSTNRCPIVD